VQEAAKQVEQLAQGGEPSTERPLAVVVKGPSLTQLFLGHTMALTMSIIMTLVLLLFLLASGDTLLRQAVTIPNALSSKKQVVEIIHETEADISHYLLSITIINAILGLAVGVALWALGMPNPTLWGAMAALFNFVPFIGPLVGVAVMTLVAFTTFDAVVDIMLPPLAYLLLHNLEAQLFTPLFLARRLVLNPVAILLSLILWSWLWGVAGALLAVPLLSAFKIVCDHVEGLHPVGVMLGRGVPVENGSSG
jgi:predicted PurR-regulated permease PerM